MITADILKIALVQADLHWENPEANLKMFDEMLSKVPGDTDLVILPEMCTTGFTMEPHRVAHPPDSEVHCWFAESSERLKMALCGSIVASDGGQYFNRMLWADGGQVSVIYDKRHLFRMAGEHEVYTPGKHQGPIQFKGWTILPRICYDLRFPVWSRDGRAHLQIYVANWPAARIDAWDKLLMARSIENLCYTVGVNRVGKDGKQIGYNGHTAVIDFKGQPIQQAEEGKACVVLTQLELSALSAFRQKFPAHLDADRFTVHL